MKCPYQDIGCWYIDDVTHDCEAEKTSDCRHQNFNEQAERCKNKNEDEEE